LAFGLFSPIHLAAVSCSVVQSDNDIIAAP
jgi:hypothetical protein